MALLVEYFVTDEFTIAFLVSADRDQPDAIEIPLTRDALRTMVDEAFGVGAVDGGLRRLNPADWSKPFEPLLAPLAGRLGEDEVVWFVPHDVLHYVPLHAVRLDGAWLADRHPVCYTPSASVMRYCRARRQPDSRAVRVFAAAPDDRPLVHAYEQGVAVDRLFGDVSRLYTGQAASVPAFVAAGAPARVVHLACHGVFDPDEPMHSGLLLAPNGDHDGLLTAAHVLGLRLPVDLVTLSACQTGVNVHRPGDELIGLTRAFVLAGAASLLVSLWAVDELSTSLLMREFYSALLTGTPKAAALRAAQLRLRATTAGDVVGYCTAALDAGAADGSRALLATDVADAQLRAGDAAAALAAYRALLDEAIPGSAHAADLARASARCRAVLRSGSATVDYGRTLFDHPYYWAPFTLIGDWR